MTPKTMPTYYRIGESTVVFGFGAYFRYGSKNNKQMLAVQYAPCILPILLIFFINNMPSR